MNKYILVVLLMGFAGFSLWAQDVVEPDAVPESAVGEPETLDVEPLMRGPIHEAYAEPLMAEDEEPLVVPLDPPAPIEEIPPEAKPAGARVVWISGYWSWDDERQDFIWVSGVWRKSPVGRTWLSGSWEKLGAGYQWIPGRWVPDGQLQVNDAPLPAPPPSLERGPTSDAVSDDEFWVPGCWQFRDSRYVWRPGFWSPCYENWVWVPDHYVVVPQGCSFVSGYWDYGWDSRGTLYAPCYINRRIAYQPGFYYSPSVVVDVSNAFFHLWVRPSYGHYYFGDYYGSNYGAYGYRPWYSYGVGYRYGYDPLFAYYHWNFRRDKVDLYRHLQHRHLYYQQHAAARPAHHWHSGSRGTRGNVALTNAQRQELVHRPAERRQLAATSNQQQAIRDQVLEQHRQRLRSGGDSLADSPRGGPNGVRRASGSRAAGDRNANVSRRAGGNVVRSIPDRQLSTVDGVRGDRTADGAPNGSTRFAPQRRSDALRQQAADQLRSPQNRRAVDVAGDRAPQRRAASDSITTRAQPRVETPERALRVDTFRRSTSENVGSATRRNPAEGLGASPPSARTEAPGRRSSDSSVRRAFEGRNRGSAAATPEASRRAIPSGRSEASSVTRSLPSGADRVPPASTPDRAASRVPEVGSRSGAPGRVPRTTAIPNTRGDRSLGDGNTVRGLPNRATSAPPAAIRSAAPRAMPSAERSLGPARGGGNTVRGLPNRATSAPPAAIRSAAPRAMPSAARSSGPALGGAARSSSPARAPAMRGPASSRGMSGGGPSARGSAARGPSGRGGSSGRGRGN